MNLINIQTAKNILDMYFSNQCTPNYHVYSSLFKHNLNIRNVSIEDSMNNIFYQVEFNQKDYLFIIRDYKNGITLFNASTNKSTIIQYYNSLNSNEQLFQMQLQFCQTQLLMIDIIIHVYTNHLNFNVQDVHNMTLSSLELINTKDAIQSINIIRQINKHI